jgi:heat shock protein HslJ
LIGAILLGLLLLSAGRPTAASDATALEGPTWRLTHLRGQEDSAIEALPEAPTVRFAAGQVQGFGGCNHLAGSYALDGDRLTLGRLAGTMMACAQPVMAVEAAYKQALSGVLHYAVAEGRLTLAAEPGGQPVLVFAVVPPLQLEGVTWEVTEYNNGRRAVVNTLNGTTLTVSFQNGTLTGNAGCNTIHAPYTRDGDRLTIGPVAATRMHCNDKAVMEQERQFVAALESTTSWAIERDRLDLHRGDGQRVLLARPAAK